MRLLVIFLWCLSFAASAQTAQPTPEDPVANKRAVQLADQLRCLVCRGPSAARVKMNTVSPGPALPASAGLRLTVPRTLAAAGGVGLDAAPDLMPPSCRASSIFAATLRANSEFGSARLRSFSQ